ncbi:MAG: ABC transporter ATP-binding protein [Mariniblastus sp.]|nr:ABC transporter ATP-binding protein [Mariniblastus sp.]
MIEIEQLRFRYPRSDFLLKIPELTINPCEKVAIVGPSGSGKTTLLNLIAGIEVPSSGKIVVDSHELSQMPDARRRDFRIAKIGMVFQQFELVEYLDVRGNVLLPFAINQSLKLTPAIRLKANEIAEQLGLGAKLKRRSHELSQGEQQRVAICRALITNPKLILADEPTGNLDPANKHLILKMMFQQAAERQQTLVVVTHDMGILEGFDRVIDFEQFRIESSVAKSRAGKPSSFDRGNTGGGTP